MQFANWGEFAERHASDEGVTGSLARALATAVELLTEVPVWMERLDDGRHVITDRMSGHRQIIVGDCMDVVAHATVFAATHGGVMKMDVVGLDLPIAQLIEETGLVEVIKLRQGSRVQ